MVLVASHSHLRRNSATVPSAGDGSVIVRSAWHTGTGNGSAAMKDTDSPTPWNGPFDTVGSSYGRIVTAASLGLANWPTANAFLMTGRNSGGSGIPTVQVRRRLGIPENGTVRGFRYYYQNLWGNGHGSVADTNMHEHGVEMADNSANGGGGGDGFQFSRLPRSDGTWFPAFRDISPNSGWRFYANGLSLNKNETYRIEWKCSYGVDTYTVEIRIYNAAGTLVATAADFIATLGTTGPLSEAAVPYTPSDHDWFGMGTNGPTSNYPLDNIEDQDPLQVAGAVFVGTDWPGPYNAEVEGPV